MSSRFVLLLLGFAVSLPACGDNGKSEEPRAQTQGRIARWVTVIEPRPGGAVELPAVAVRIALDPKGKIPHRAVLVNGVIAPGDSSTNEFVAHRSFAEAGERRITVEIKSEGELLYKSTIPILMVDQVAGKKRSQRALAVLGEAHPDETALIGAIVHVMRTHDIRAVSGLEGVLRSKEPPFYASRASALRALGLLLSLRSVPLLVSLLDDPDVGSNAAMALRHFGDEEWPPVHDGSTAGRAKLIGWFEKRGTRLAGLLQQEPFSVKELRAAGTMER